GLLLARLSGVCIVYTVHNVWQHEGRYPWLVGLGNRVILALAQAVHVHDDETVASLREQGGLARLGSRKRPNVYVIPHGNYVPAYPNDCSRVTARTRLGLDDSTFVYLFLGRVRPYKGIEELLVAFKALDARDMALVVAGELHEPHYARRVRELARGDARIRLYLQFVPDDELQVYLNGCDICVLPYRHVTTSGAAFLAFSFGVPIVAPRKGYFVQLVGDKERGILYDAPAWASERGAPRASQKCGSLTDALRQARECDVEAMSAACTRFIARFDWDTIAQQHAAMYRQCG
ncbi:MAG TPA: glycosyltransferase, partial [Anaerolineae bacterium]|nr:glycosyltransferase [Anaerolineae bacterium]